MGIIKKDSLFNNTDDEALPTSDEDIIQELSAFKKALGEATILTITDRFDHITYANEKFCRITKYSLNEVIGKTHHELVYSGCHSDKFFEDILNQAWNGQAWNGEICNKAKDGSLYWVDTTIVPFLNLNGDMYQLITIMHDITEKKLAEEMLRKTEKLSLVGELAAGFAHEIRNPLTTIKGFVQILDSFSEEKRRHYSKIILDEIDRINFIVSEFMLLAKPHNENFSVVNLCDIIRGVVSLLKAEATLKNVKIMHSFNHRDIYIYGDKNQLTQVFINIVKNAIDAMADGGQIKLTYAIRKNDIMISIKDNGIGMTQEQLKRIAEPFYTTKEKGNGLGLMISYKIIENHRGRINVASEPGKGTTFMITFPLVENHGDDSFNSEMEI